MNHAEKRRCHSEGWIRNYCVVKQSQLSEYRRKSILSWRSLYCTTILGHSFACAVVPLH
ncbi:hypothetical protein BDZ89DRAFT_497573 [Hymenopellis radicata]|nr:hypothetical protein BDZ89DRAFT_497573 [Hymenopellis radicata]